MDECSSTFESIPISINAARINLLSPGEKMNSCPISCGDAILPDNIPVESKPYSTTRGKILSSNGGFEIQTTQSESCYFNFIGCYTAQAYNVKLKTPCLCKIGKAEDIFDEFTGGCPLQIHSSQSIFS